jgi:hypothetical protein
MAMTGARYNIGDPALAVDRATRALWHSFLTAPRVECSVDSSASADNSIAVTSSRDLGVSWSEPALLDLGPYARNYFIDRPSLGAVAGAVFVTFVAVPAAVDDPNTDVAVAGSEDGGQTWSVSTVSGTGRTALRRAPTLSTPGRDRLQIAWFESARPGAHYGSVWVARSLDGGKTFAEQKLSADLLAREDGPSLAAFEQGKIVYVVFGASVDARSSEAVYVAASADGGATFGGPTRLANLCGSAWSPTAAADASGSLWISWYQANQGTSQVAWLKGARAAGSSALSPTLGFVPNSRSPFTMSRSPFVSLGDFLGLGASNGVLVAAWTHINQEPLGGVIYTSAADTR